MTNSFTSGVFELQTRTVPSSWQEYRPYVSIIPWDLTASKLSRYEVCSSNFDIYCKDRRIGHGHHLHDKRPDRSADILFICANPDLSIPNMLWLSSTIRGSIVAGEVNSPPIGKVGGDIAFVCAHSHLLPTNPITTISWTKIRQTIKHVQYLIISGPNRVTIILCSQRLTCFWAHPMLSKQIHALSTNTLNAQCDEFSWIRCLAFRIA
jgi:hypothetical protein